MPRWFENHLSNPSDVPRALDRACLRGPRQVYSPETRRSTRPISLKRKAGLRYNGPQWVIGTQGKRQTRGEPRREGHRERAIGNGREGRLRRCVTILSSRRLLVKRGRSGREFSFDSARGPWMAASPVGAGSASSMLYAADAPAEVPEGTPCGPLRGTGRFHMGVFSEAGEGRRGDAGDHERIEISPGQSWLAGIHGRPRCFVNIRSCRRVPMDQQHWRQWPVYMAERQEFWNCRHAWRPDSNQLRVPVQR